MKQSAQHLKNKSKGFTLIELLIVITIIGILAGIMVRVIDPEYWMADARNATRKTDIHGIGIAVANYALDKGVYPTTITDTQTEICRQDAADCTDLIDLSVLTDAMLYLSNMPEDPKFATDNGTGYDISVNAAGYVIVVAPNAEKGEVIQVIR